MLRFGYIFTLALLVGCHAEPSKTLGGKPIKEKDQEETPTIPLKTEYASAVLQRLTHRLYLAVGDQRRAEPRIVLSRDSQYVASCRQRENTIILEEKAFQLCRQFGKDSLALLGFLIGHELGHLLTFSKPSQTSPAFLSYYRQQGADSGAEGNADLFGIFSCQLAGLSGVRKHIARFIDNLYAQYHFQESITHYPSKKERQAYTQWIGRKTDSLSQIWDAGLFLLTLQRYPESMACFDYILQYYQGAEVWHNLGTAAAMYSVQLQSLKQENLPYYPFMAEDQLRLQTFRGRLTPAEERTLHQNLDRAILALETAVQQRPQYLPSSLNLLMTYLLQGDLDKADRCFKKNTPLMTSDQYQFYKNLLALHHIPSSAELPKNFEKLSSAADPMIAQAAKRNLKILLGEPFNPAPIDCPLPSFYPDHLKPIHLKIPQSSFFRLSNTHQLALSALPHSQLLQFQTEDSDENLNLQIVYRPSPAPYAHFGGVGARWTPQNVSPTILGKSTAFWHPSPCYPAIKTNKRNDIIGWALILPEGM